MPEDNEKAVPWVGEVWTYKGQRYEIKRNGDSLRVKDAGDGNWHRAVEYDQLPENGEPKPAFTFVRKESDFLDKFEREL